MKFVRQFLYKVEDGQPNIVIAGLDLMDILAHITYLIHYLYCKFKGNNPELAKAFREMLTQTIVDPTSPVWEKEVVPAPGAFETFFTLNKEDVE